MPKCLGYIARDQYGNTFHIGNNPPRKWLLDYLGQKHAQKIYLNNLLDETVSHIGYIIAGHWIYVYRIFPFKEEPEPNKRSFGV